MYTLKIVDIDTNERGCSVHFNFYMNGNMVNQKEPMLLSEEEFQDFASILSANVVPKEAETEMEEVYGHEDTEQIGS